MTRDSLAFLAAFLRHPGQTGAIAPSSRALARAMVRGLEPGPTETIVEFGPGTGAFTGAICEAVGSPERYVGFEINAEFIARLRRRFPGLAFVHASAAAAPDYFAATEPVRVRAVVCGLPFASLPPGVQDAIVAALDRLVRPGAEFRTFQYIHAFGLPPAVRFRRRMAALFGPPVRVATVWPNLPPAFVLRWGRSRTGIEGQGAGIRDRG